MSEYIERGALSQSESICRSCFHSCVCEQFNEHRESHNKKCHFYISRYVNAADVVEVKHGKWVEKDCVSKSTRGRVIHYVTNKCSVCGEWNGRHKNNYCPNCGCRMDGGADNG